MPHHLIRQGTDSLKSHDIRNASELHLILWTAVYTVCIKNIYCANVFYLLDIVNRVNIQEYEGRKKKESITSRKF